MTSLNIITPNRGFKYLADAEEEFRLAEQMLEQAKRQGKRKPKPATTITPLTPAESLEGFIYVPSLNLYVAKQRTHLNCNWFDCHKNLQKQGNRMLTIPQFISFVKYVKQHNPEIYEDITAVREPWRSEYLDADFKVVNGKLNLNQSHILDSSGNLIPQYSQPLDKNTLMKDRNPGINLESWLKNPTIQGLPKSDVSDGDLYYYFPRSDNNSVARFYADSSGADLGCDGGPSGRYSALGVRATKSRE